MKNNATLLPRAKEVRFVADQLANVECSTEEMLEHLHSVLNETMSIDKQTVMAIMEREWQNSVCSFPYYPDLYEICGSHTTHQYYTPEQEALFYASVQS